MTWAELNLHAALRFAAALDVVPPDIDDVLRDLAGEVAEERYYAALAGDWQAAQSDDTSIDAIDSAPAWDALETA